MTPLLALAALGCSAAPTAMSAEKTLYDFKAKSLAGKKIDLADYRGKLVLVVNTASKCGLTPQYKGLQALYDKYKAKGLVILGFPANDFKEQEPGTSEEISAFCTKNYGVTFPMFEKSTVLGDDKTPLYRWLIAHSDRPKDEIEWNFAKFLIDREGHEVARFKPQETPETIEDQIAAKL